MSDLDKMSQQQRDDWATTRENILQDVIADIEEFYRLHPELRVTFSLELRPVFRESGQETRR